MSKYKLSKSNVAYGVPNLYAWNPTQGCTPASEGCRNCYAKAIHDRFHTDDPFSNVKIMWNRLDPIFPKKPSIIFVGNMSDIFHEGLQTEASINPFYGRILQNTEENPQHVFLFLTKRKPPEEFLYSLSMSPERLWNVWLGCSICTFSEQELAIAEAIIQLKPYVGGIWLSIEPFLPAYTEERFKDNGDFDSYILNQNNIVRLWENFDWVVLGGESNSNRILLHDTKATMDTPSNIWYRNARGIEWNCLDHEIPFYFKQFPKAFKSNYMNLEFLKQHPEAFGVKGAK